MIATAPEPQAAVAQVMNMDPEVNLVAAVAMVPEVLVSNKMMTIVLAALASNKEMTMVPETLAVAQVMAMVPETPAVAQVMTMVLELLAAAQAMIMDPVAPVAMAQAISLEAASVAVPTRTLVVGQAMMTTTTRRVCKHLRSYLRRFRIPRPTHV